VDNEMIFREVVMKENYSEYFSDMFGRRFGHCTPKATDL